VNARAPQALIAGELVLSGAAERARLLAQS
jgi:hypothetical protein